MEVCTVVCTLLRRLPTVVLSNAGPSFSPGSGPGPGSCLFETVGRQASLVPALRPTRNCWKYVGSARGAPFWPASVFSTSTLCQSQPPHYLVLPVPPWKVKEELTGGEKGRKWMKWIRLWSRSLNNPIEMNHERA
jgi:hypothetical protein